MPLLSHSPSSHMLHTLSSVRAYTPTFPILSYQSTTFFSPPFFSLCPLPPPFLYSPARPHLSPLPSALSSPYWFFRVLLLPFVRSGPFVPFPSPLPPSVAVMASERLRRKKRGGREASITERRRGEEGGSKRPRWPPRYLPSSRRHSWVPFSSLAWRECVPAPPMATVAATDAAAKKGKEEGFLSVRPSSFGRAFPGILTFL